VLSNRKQPSESPPSELCSEPGARNTLGPEQPIVQSKSLRFPAPEMFAKFAKFANFTVIATLTHGIPAPLGVVGHEGSTLFVVLNGLRLLRWRGLRRLQEDDKRAGKATLRVP
jgi:hypothetical protein